MLKNFIGILLILFLTLSGCKSGETASCTGSSEAKMLESFFEKPTQIAFAAKVKAEKLQQIGYVNQYNANYVIKYNWGQYGPCYGFYTFNAASGELEQVKYYWGDSIRVFENANTNTSNNKTNPDTSATRYECFADIYNTIDYKLNNNAEICNVVTLPRDSAFSHGPGGFKLKNKFYTFKNYFAEITLTYYPETGSMLLWDLDYRETSENTLLCQ